MSHGPERLAAALADRYRLEHELGQGGMATVYLAEDLKHRRKVALKVLKPELAAVLGAERFVQEITTTAALQHPHILPLFDSGEADGFLYYVMPFIDGETLRAKLDRETQLGVEEAVKLTTAVADALDYAHRQGVIHRDIKPENILLHEGRPMVADFGIALAVSAAAGGRMTETGLSLGTPHYMSPEQATAEKEITRRSDLYSLASVLYEMLTGNPPHTGASAQQIIMKIITEAPADVTALRKAVPPHVAAALAKALEKLPADRFESADMFARALNDPGFAIRTGSIAHAAGTNAGHGRWRRAALVLGGTTALAVGAAFWLALGARDADSASSSVSAQFDLQLPEGVELPAKGWLHTAVSPDGQTIAFLGFDGKTRRAYLRRLVDPEVRAISGTDSARFLFFSPDGRSLGFITSDRLLRFDLADGRITPIVPLVIRGTAPGGASWGADSVIVFSQGGSLWKVSAAGGNATKFLSPDSTRGDAAFFVPRFLPDGRSFVFSIWRGAGEPALAIGTLEGEVTELGVSGIGTHFVATSGHLLYSTLAGGGLYGVRLSPDRESVLGPPRQVLDNLQVSQGSVPSWSASPTGTVVVDRGAMSSRLVVVDRRGKVQPLSEDAREYRLPRVSPDGQRIVVQVSTTSQEGLWLFDRRTGTFSRFTPTGPFSDGIWMPDGARIVYAGAGADGSVDVFIRRADGGADAVALVEGARQQWPWTLTPDGRTLIFADMDADLVMRLLEVPTEGGTSVPRKVMEDAGYSRREPRLSPDGRWLAFTSNETGRTEVYVQPYPGPGGKQQVSLSGGDQPVWSPDGRELFYRDERHVISAVLRLDGAVSVSARTPLFEDRFERSNATDYDVLPDGRGFVMLEPQAGTRRLTVMVNWGPELRRLLGSSEP